LPHQQGKRVNLGGELNFQVGHLNFFKAKSRAGRGRRFKEVEGVFFRIRVQCRQVRSAYITEQSFHPTSPELR
jgi:hypothetical protein